MASERKQGTAEGVSTPLSKAVILGSSSIYRQRLLKEMDIPFTVQTADINEKAVNVEGGGDRARADPAKLPLAVARAKAIKILSDIKVLSHHSSSRVNDWFARRASL